MGRSVETVRQMVLQNTLFDAAETQRIYQKYFRAPSRTDALLMERYQLDQKRVVEVGCAYGYSMIWFGEGSVGLDVRQVFVDFGASIGLDIRLANAEDPMPAFEQPFEALVCGNLVEHVIAPHLLLMRFRTLIEDDGLLCIKVPVTPPRWVWKLYQRLGVDHGFDNAQHINFFSPRTIQWTVERAGYQVIGLHNPMLESKPWLAWMYPLLGNYLPSVVVVARKIENFQYHPERIAEYNSPYAPDLLPYYRA